jgi:hypothetical protein
MHDNKLLLERFIAGEIDENGARQVTEHCSTCAECSDYLTSLKTARRQFQAEYPFSRFMRAATPAARQPWYEALLDGLRRPALVPAYGFIAVFLIMSPILYVKYFQAPSQREIAFKGDDGLSFLLKRNGRVSDCTTRDTLYPGDQIQVLYTCSKHGNLSLLSVDAHGAISWYHPDRNSPVCSVPVKPGKNGYPSGIQLDDSPGQELVIALFSSAPLSKESVQTWISRTLKKTNKDLFKLKLELDATGKKIIAKPTTALFQKGK